MYALPAQVFRLVKAVRPAPARALDADHSFDDCALRRRPAERQIEAGRLTRLDIAEAQHPDRNADGEHSSAGRPGYLEPGELHSADLVGKDAPIERVQADASVPPASEENRRAESSRPAVPEQ